jgi:hypothetical protein
VSSYYTKAGETYWWLFGLTGIFFVAFIVLMLVGNYKKISFIRTRNIFINRVQPGGEGSTAAANSSQMNLLRALVNADPGTAQNASGEDRGNIYLGKV